MTSHGRISVDEQRVFELLSQELYGDPRVFLRELLANAHDAIVRREQSRHAASRGVRIETTRTAISVEDEGIGMHREELVQLLSRIGGSSRGTAPADVIGRFGVGFLSSLAVAERVEVSTLAAEAGAQPLEWSWSGGMEYQIHAGRRSAPGTLVTVHLKEASRHLRDPECVREFLRTELPWLPLEIDVDGDGDPRPLLPPWNRSTPQRQPELRQVFERWDRPVLHAARHPIVQGGHVLLGLPQRASAGRLWIFERGIRVVSQLDAVVPELFRWTLTVVNLDSAALTVSRTGLRSESLLQLTQELHTMYVRELAWLSDEQPTVVADLLASHRSDLLRLLAHERSLLRSLGAAVKFTTTLGALSFSEAIERTRPAQAGRAVLYRIESDPEGDHRWSAAKARFDVVVYTRSEDELSLLLELVADHGACELRTLDFSPELGTAQVVGTLPAYYRAFLDELRRHLAQHDVRVEPELIEPATLFAATEVVRSSIPGRSAVSAADSFLDAFTQVLTTLGAADAARPAARLLVNVRNPELDALARGAPAAHIEALAALLFVSGLVRSGVTLHDHWLELVDQLLARATRALTGGELSSVAGDSPHVICFFAHDFGHHKQLLPHIREVLEHAPFYWEVVSADEKVAEPDLFDNVEQLIQRSHVMLADVSTQNANVTLEAGYMLGLRRPLVLLDTRAARQPLANLRSRLSFTYDARWFEPKLVGPRGQSPFSHTLREYVLSIEQLRTLRLYQPYLSYRLLREAGLCSQEDVSRLAKHLPDASGLLDLREPERIARACHISSAHLQAMCAWFKTRVSDFHGP